MNNFLTNNHRYLFLLQFFRLCIKAKSIDGFKASELISIQFPGMILSEILDDILGIGDTK